VSARATVHSLVAPHQVDARAPVQSRSGGFQGLWPGPAVSGDLSVFIQRIRLDTLPISTQQANWCVEINPGAILGPVSSDASPAQAVTIQGAA
jgi:hypothetical protein